MGNVLNVCSTPGSESLRASYDTWAERRRDGSSEPADGSASGEFSETRRVGSMLICDPVQRLIVIDSAYDQAFHLAFQSYHYESPCRDFFDGFH